MEGNVISNKPDGIPCSVIQLMKVRGDWRTFADLLQTFQVVYLLIL